jgi:endoglucanase
MNRRQLLQASIAAAIGSKVFAGAPPSTQPMVNALPRWRGFNLLNLFDADHPRPFEESDFALVAEWGFDFVRVPMSYLAWSSKTDWTEIRDEPLKNLDRAIAWGQQYKVHVNLNLHRIPGYCVNPPKEPASLWVDPVALDAAAHQWTALAERYKDAPAEAVSFDLINEPGDIHEDVYVKVVTRLVEAIRRVRADRIVNADGLKWGNEPVTVLYKIKPGQSTRGYTPMQVSHYGASWIHGSEFWPVPTWPLNRGTTETWDKARLKRDRIKPWQRLEATGVGVHVGEWGSHNRTPHDVSLAWMQDNLELWQEAGWGWSLWNLFGSFGILDSGRKDVQYESFRGHSLDRKMLELLRRF